MLPRLLARDTDGFATTLALMGNTLGEAPLSALLAAPGYAALAGLVGAATGADADEREEAAATLDETLDRVALLVDAPAAVELITRLVALGLSPADPTVELLHLNAALVSETTP